MKPDKSFVHEVTQRFLSMYSEVVEEFFRILGVTEENVHECEFRHPHLDALSGKIFRNGEELGSVTVIIEHDDVSKGCRWSIQCKPSHGKDA